MWRGKLDAHMTGLTDVTAVTVPIHVRTQHPRKQPVAMPDCQHQPVSGSHCAEPKAAVSLWESISMFFMLTSQSLWCPLEIRTAVAFVAGPWEVAFLTECQPAAPRLRAPEQPKCAQLGVTDNGHHPFMSCGIASTTHRTARLCRNPPQRPP